MSRSLPELAILAESSLMSLSRWSYKAGMEKSMSSANGQIALVNRFALSCKLVLSVRLVYAK